MGSHTFTRQELYVLVLSEPMTKLGARFGISGNGLKKACKRASIPVPPQGYWAKIKAGHKAAKTPLPPATAGMSAKVTIDPPSARPAPPPPPVPGSVQEKIAAERQSGKPVTVPTTLASPHRIVTGWIQDSRREMQKARHDPWASNWSKPIDGTPLEKRRLRILSALFNALETRGYKLIVGESYHRPVQIGLGDKKTEVHLTERMRHVRRHLTDGEKAGYGYSAAQQRWTQEKVPTGELILKIKTERYIADKEWRDKEDAPLERQLNEVIAQIAGMFESIRLRLEQEAAERKRQWEEAERRRLAEMERKRELIRFRRLVSQCDNWRTAADIRALVAAIAANPVATENAEKFTKWQSWALAYADRIDPLQDRGLFDRRVSDCEVYSLRD